jgi:ParB family transcriptional regulator, chromosome partitioning protein
VPKRGLPNNFKLRHDAHYVELLVGKTGSTPIGRMIAVDKLAPNPNQPRADVGDLSELVSSIRQKGVLEPLLVRPSDVGGRYMIISGERRFRASLEAGLNEVPCIEMDVNDRDVAEICLIENLQRKDLNAFEEADGLQALADRFGYTHEQIAQKIGKSRSSITESLSIASLPAEIRDTCRRADITSKSMLLQVVRQPTVDEMKHLVERVTESGLSREEARSLRSGKAKPKGYVYKYQAKGQSYSILVKFRKAQARRSEVEAALVEALEDLRSK